MSDELTKTFFDTFEIGPFYKAEQCDGWGRTVAEGFFVKKEDAEKFGIVFGDNPQYPEITDSILLKLMELLIKQQATEFYYHDEYLFSSKLLGSNRPICNRVKNLRELVLRTANCLGGFTPLKDGMLKQVQALFKENN